MQFRINVVGGGSDRYCQTDDRTDRLWRYLDGRNLVSKQFSVVWTERCQGVDGTQRPTG